MSAPIPAEPQPTVGGWQFSSVPNGWIFDPQLGLRCTVPGITASIHVAEEPLPGYTDFDQYVESQLALARRFLSNPTISNLEPSHFPICEVARAVAIRYVDDAGKHVVQAQIYVLVEGVVGIATFTTTQEHTSSVRSAFDLVKKNIQFRHQQRRSEG